MNRTKLEKGQAISFNEGVRIKNVETVVYGEKHGVTIDWDLRVVFVERAKGDIVWVPFENVRFGIGGLSAYAPTSVVKKVG